MSARIRRTVLNLESMESRDLPSGLSVLHVLDRVATHDAGVNDLRRANHVDVHGKTAGGTGHSVGALPTLATSIFQTPFPGSGLNDAAGASSQVKITSGWQSIAYSKTQGTTQVEVTTSQSGNSQLLDLAYQRVGTDGKVGRLDYSNSYNKVLLGPPGPVTPTLAAGQTVNVSFYWYLNTARGALETRFPVGRTIDFGERTPRMSPIAVGLSPTGQKVFAFTTTFTVNAGQSFAFPRRPGFLNVVTLDPFAEYLKKLGLDTVKPADVTGIHLDALVTLPS